MKKEIDNHPEDVFIDRYMPGASSSEREAARQNVRNLVAALVRIGERLGREDRDSRESDSRVRFNEGRDNPGL